LRVMMIGPYPRSPGRIDGGVAAAMTYLSQALVAAKNVELTGVRITWDGEGSLCDDFGWPIVDLSIGRFGLTTLYRRQMARLRELIRRHQPHVIHGQGVDVAGYLSVNSGVPAVVTVHGLLSENAKYQTDLATKMRGIVAGMLTERRTVRLATDLIAISPFVVQYYNTHIAGRLHEVPNAISPRFFGLKRHPESRRYLYAGRIANGKGLIDLVRAIAGNVSPATKVVLAGAASDRSYENEVRMETEKLGLSHVVTFAGLLDEEALLGEFSRAEALILPSLQETAPMVVQQAMAAGLAVVASRVGGIPYQIEHDATGLLFEAGNVAELSGLVGRLAADSSLSLRLGEAARKRAKERYDASEIAQSTIAVYRTALCSNTRSGVRRKSP